MSGSSVLAMRAGSTRFTPRKPDIVSIGKTSVSLYPKVDASMSDPEKAMAFQQNKTALASAELDQKARILALADRLDLMLTAESSLADWERKLFRNWANFANLSILSWHSGNDNLINNTVTAVDASILLPVQDGAAHTCRAPGVKFVRVQLALDYADLNRIDPVPNTTLRGEYYIQPPQDSIDLINGVGNPYCLTTFTGAADLRTLTVEAVKRDILDATHQDGPYDLLEPSFNLTSCRTKSTVTYGELKSQVIRLSSATIHHQLFEVLVPGYTLEPHNVLDHIFQSYIDQDGNHQRLSSQVYYTTFLNAVCSFYDLEEYPINIAGIFMDHIDPRLAKGFRINYPDFGKARSRGALTQRTLLTDMLSALIKTEKSVSNILDVIGEARGGEQFLIPGGSAPAFPSVAETTLNRYSKGDDSTKGSDTTGGGSFIERTCFGCGQPHAWSKKEKGQYVIVCPNANKPGITEHAAAQIKDFQARRGRKHSKATKRKNLNTVNWDDIPSERREVLLQQHRASSVVTTDGGGSVGSSITGATTSPTRASSNCNGSLTLHQDVVVLSSKPSKPPIPIAIHSPMAHISLQTGTSAEEKDCPNLRCVVDTGAALSTANFHYMEAVIRQYSHILKRIYLPADYAAIVLSGIVTTSDSPITTELPVGFEIHLNYLTKDGSDTSFLVAAGPDVAVNLILGLPFIKATGLICDFVDNVCQAKHLLCDPFPIDFKRALKSIPVFLVTGAPSNVNDSSDTLRVLASLRTIFPRHSDGDTGTIHPSQSKIQFGD